MKEKILHWGPLAALASLNPLIYVALISMIPIVELRGAIPVGIALDLPWWQVYIVSILAATLPAPFIILFFAKFLEFIREKKWLPWLTNFLDKKFTGKEEAFGVSKFWGILLFVAIPLPGTGAWTASGIASLIKMDFKQALTAVFLGNILAATIVTIISVLGKQSIGWLMIVLGVLIGFYAIWHLVMKKHKFKKTEE